MTKNTPSFQQYQQAFTAHIRDPKGQSRPKGVKASRMNVYKEIVFNNLFESVSACYPVAREVLGKRAWLKLIRLFFQQHSANTPIFRKIPEEFLAYLNEVSATNSSILPPYLTSLCHYEWIELLVSTMQEGSNHGEIDPLGELLTHQPVFTPTMQLLNYEYAVQKISPRYKPKDKLSTQLLVYRDADFTVKFIELNATTFRLIELLKRGNLDSQQALTLLATELHQADEESVIQFGLALLEDLRHQGVILGVDKLVVKI